MKDTEPSSTAYTVLQGLLYVALYSSHRYLVQDETVQIGRQLFEHSSQGRKRLKQLHSKISHVTAACMEAVLVPGIRLHYALRKRKIAAITEQAIQDGYQQIVNLGAGFDCLLWSIHQRYLHVNCIEIDHPSTSVYKQDALDTHQQARTNFHFLSVDFSQQHLEDVLNGYAGFIKNVPTLYICEGVLMYLHIEDIQRLFRAIQQLTGRGSLLCYTGLEPQHSSRSNTSRLLLQYLRLIGEPIRWCLPSEQSGAFLADLGAELQMVAGTDEMVAEFIDEPVQEPLHYGEYVVLTQFV